MPDVSVMKCASEIANRDSIYLEISTFICEVTELVQMLIYYSANILGSVDC